MGKKLEDSKNKEEKEEKKEKPEKKEKSNSAKKNKKKRRKKKNKKSKNKGQSEQKKTMFRGINGTEYDEEGNEKENIDDSEDENNKEFTSPFLNDYLTHIKSSNKINKAKKYLEDFHNKKWKFNKILQIQILKYILYENVFEAKYFEIFQEYIVNMFKATKNTFIKKCEEYIDVIKKSNEDEGNLNFKIDSHSLKFQNIENKKSFLFNLNKRCTDIIENN